MKFTRSLTQIIDDSENIAALEAMGRRSLGNSMTLPQTPVDLVAITAS
jgi:hypothetical protein